MYPYREVNGSVPQIREYVTHPGENAPNKSPYRIALEHLAVRAFPHGTFGRLSPFARRNNLRPP